ncbi:MAG: lysine--tRNA ligase [FCB group bacterium]|nr:lysine--tRNA ligase [FCB group bacterium]
MSQDHRSLQQIIDFRLEKLARIRAAGYDPYPYKFDPDTQVQSIQETGDDLVGTPVSIAGRLVSLRKMGKASFAHIQDESGKQQIYVKRDDVGADVYNNLFKNLDIGDIIGVRGDVFRTKTGELTLHVRELTLLAKSIRPLPNLKEKDGQAFNEFDDKELRYRQRHLDFIANPEVKTIFRQRAAIIRSIRNFFDTRGFVEVETPALQPIYGGASARPFTTYHNTLEQKLYLRIADELYLKRLIIGGFEKVYELAKNFRNEGMDRNHNPEYTSLEFYQAYQDLYDMMELTEELIKTAAAATGKRTVNFGGKTIDLTMPFERKSMFELLNKKTGKTIEKMAEQQLLEYAQSLKLEVSSKMNYGQLLDKLFGELIEPDLVQPTFVYDYPKAISPLAKVKRNGDGTLVERFELFIGGMEFANSFSELTDPLDQRQRLEAQAKLRELGDEEAQVVDENFLQALEVGMPPTGGVGIGVDRLVMLLTEQNSIKDVILFPALRQI